MEAYKLKLKDESDKMHALAFLCASANSVDENGEPLYPTFQDFLNAKGKPDRFAALKEHLRKEKENGRKL